MMATIDMTPEQLHAHITGRKLELVASTFTSALSVEVTELAALRKDAERWRVMRQCFEGVDWFYGVQGRSVALFTLHSGVVTAGPEGADALADAAMAGRG
jgi:hypothetical protein